MASSIIRAINGRSQFGARVVFGPANEKSRQHAASGWVERRLTPHDAPNDRNAGTCDGRPRKMQQRARRTAPHVERTAVAFYPSSINENARNGRSSSFRGRSPTEVATALELPAHRPPTSLVAWLCSAKARLLTSRERSGAATRRSEPSPSGMTK
jgi:hypothetical protein